MYDLVRAKSFHPRRQEYILNAEQVGVRHLHIPTGRKETLRVEPQAKALITILPLDKWLE